ncbi:MAG: hypothetical protein NC123_18715, partial [Butyrivibrio sp.]|nr:hypothetical protein [Acetatifactor muris]MCM1561545.1 hypothetical protein [Butyrivibrio sp.]
MGTNKMKKSDYIGKKQAGAIAGFQRIFALAKIFALPFIIIAAAYRLPIQALAAEAAVSFGSE